MAWHGCNAQRLASWGHGCFRTQALHWNAAPAPVAVDGCTGRGSFCAPLMHARQRVTTSSAACIACCLPAYIYAPRARCWSLCAPR